MDTTETYLCVFRSLNTLYCIHSSFLASLVLHSISVCWNHWVSFDERVHSTSRFERVSQALAVETSHIICCVAFEECAMAEYNSSMCRLGLTQRNRSILMVKCFKIGTPSQWGKTLPLARMAKTWVSPLSRLKSAILRQLAYMPH